MQFSLEALRAALGSSHYARGLAYAQEERVLALNEEEGRMVSEVRGSGRHTYRQEIAISATSRHLVIAGNCSCPVGFNCKHVAAVLIVHHRMQQAQRHMLLPAASGDRPSAASSPMMPPPVSAWLQRLEHALQAPAAAAGEPSTAPKRKGSAYRLVFVLTPAPDGRRTALAPCKAQLRASGDVAAATPLGDLARLQFNPPAYVVPQEDELIRLYGAMHGSAYYHQPYTEPAGKTGAQLLRMLVEEKKLLWANSMKDAAKGMLYPLVETPARSAELAWHEHDEQLRLVWQFCPPAGGSGQQAASGNAVIDYVLPTDPPWYVDNLACGELKLQHGNAMLALIAQTPLLARKDAAAVSQQLLLRGLSRFVPLPVALAESMRAPATTEIILRLGSVAFAAHLPVQDYAVLLFSYDGREVVIGAGEAAEAVILQAGPHGIEKILRDHAAERHAWQRLQQAGFATPPEGAAAVSMPGTLQLPSAAAWLACERTTLPLLAQEGWQIEKLDSYRYAVAEIDEWYAEVAPETGNPWFELELGVVVNQERVSLLPVMVSLIRHAPDDFHAAALARHADDEPLLTALPNGVRVALPWGRIKTILETLGELYFTERAASRLRLSTLDAARLAELDGNSGLRWLGGEQLRSLGAKLHAFGGVQAVAVPHGLQATLRDYQRDGLAWMQFLREYDLAGILADDMGLGKTVQTLAHILLEKEAGRLTSPALVVAPTSLMSNWQDEAGRFAPSLRVLTLQGRERLAQFDHIGEYDLVLTTYALLPRDEDRLRQHTYHLLILDEAHYIKNARSRVAQTAGLLHARHRLCLTGTPLENHLGELWSQFHFLLPGLLGDEKTFNHAFRGPIEKQGNDERRALLTRRIKPFLLRRTKDRVASELPSKTEIVRMVELTGAQRDLYETVRLAMDQKVRSEIARKGVARSQIVILDALLKLRQVCCDPRLIKPGVAKKAAAPSAKLADLLAMLEELLEEGRRILVFSQFTSMLTLIEAELQARQIPYALLTGDTADRAGAVRAFQQGQVPLFLISLKAGGVGLNLTAADTVIHYDPWWNPAAESQATDRAWRIGQDKPVFVYKLIARGTLEEKIQALQQQKAQLAAAMLGDGAAQGLSITQEDLQAILAPLSH